MENALNLDTVKLAENKKEINRLSNDNRQIEELMRQLKKLNDTSKE